MTRRAAWISCLVLAAGLPAGSLPAHAGESCVTSAPNACSTSPIFSNGSYGANNDAFGYNTFPSNVSGGGNVAVGDAAMWKSSSGDENVAVGMEALELNVSGSDNVAVGSTALLFSTADGGTAVGYESLYNNTTGPYNTGTGFQTLFSNTTGSYNTAAGYQALFSNTTGGDNAALGMYSLYGNTTGFYNTAVGAGALMHLAGGSYNVAMGLLAGSSYTGSENNNIALASSGVAGDVGVTRIGSSGAQTQAYVAGIYGATASSGIQVFVNSAGKLGTATSSLRFKEDVADLGAASDELMRLRPVSFHYKAPYDDGRRILQYGLIAEEVAAVDPGLVETGEDGQPLTVRYHFVNAMLLGEVQRQHAAIARQAAEIDGLKGTIEDLRSTLGSQGSAMAALAERLAKLEAAAPRR